MADLCTRQGHTAEALAIYGRLLARAADPVSRARLSERIAKLRSPPASSPPPPSSSSSSSSSSSPSSSPLPTPGIRLSTSASRLTVEWRLAEAPGAAALQILLVVQSPEGVTSERRDLAAPSLTGQLVLEVPGLRGARAAVGYLHDGRFVPLARG